MMHVSQRNIFSIALSFVGLLLSISAPVCTAQPSLSLTSNAVSPGSKLTVLGKSGSTLQVFDVGMQANPKCDAGAVSGLAPLATSAGTSIALSAASTNVTLASPIAHGALICLVQTDNGTSDYSDLYAVAAAAPSSNSSTTYSYFTFGAVASNQLNNSSNAAQYIDLGIGAQKWGINGTLSGRFTSQAIAAQSSGTTVANSNSGSTTFTTPYNVLTTQQSARILESISFHKKDIHSIFLSPVAKASISTLLNPTTTVSSGQSTPTAVQYSPTYNDWSVGLRTASLGEDHALEWKLDATIGKYSSLDSIQCGSNVASTVTAAPTNTSCFTPSAKTPGSYSLDNLQRIAVPRVEIDGYYLIDKKYVLGLGANLSQYSIFVPKNLDTLNRPGSEVRIYFGVTGSLEDLFKAISNLKQ